jgi:hypothetical protein
MTFHVLQSYLIRIHLPNDKDLLAWTESIFLFGIGYWNSMFFNRRDTEKNSRKKPLRLFATLRFQHFYRRGAENAEKKEDVKNPQAA